MKVECKLKRDGGTKIDLDGVEYHFKPLKDGAHVAEVTDEAHLERLQQIPEAYKPYKGEAEFPVAKPGSETADEETSDGDDEPTEFLVTDKDGKDADLGKMTKQQLLDFATAEGIAVTVTKKDSLVNILKAVFDGCMAE